MTRPIERREARPRDVLRALAATGALGVLAVAVPCMLVALARVLPLDLGALSPSAWGHADDGRLLLVAIVAVAWVAWAAMMLSVGLETWAALCRVPTPRLPGMAVPQRMAAVLVAAILVALSPGAGGPAVGAGVGTGGSALGAAMEVLPAATGGAILGAAAREGAVSGPVSDGSSSGTGWGAGAAPDTQGVPVGPAQALPDGSAGTSAPRAGGGLAAVVAAASLRAERGDDHGLLEQSRIARAAGQGLDGTTIRSAAPTVTTERHDTLWLLAEHHLGAGERYVEIVGLNRGVGQPDGRSLGDDGRIYPGWTLVLPADATVPSERPARHRVVPGDTLWQIAEDELGDPTRYPEIAEANRGDLQPDGRRLADPDLILPGWVLEIPGVEESMPLADPAAQQGADPAAGATTSQPPAGPAEGSADDSTPGVASPAAVPSATAMALIDRAPAESASSSAEPPPTARPVASANAVDGVATLERGMGDGTGIDVGPSGSPAASPEDPVAGSPGAAGAAGAGASAPAASAASAAPAAPAASAASATSAASAEGGSTGDSAEVGGPAVDLPAGGAVAALLMAGVGAELVRRRRQFQRHRRPGERMPAAGPGAQQVERAARDSGHEPGLDLLERALVQLADQAEAGGYALPDVRLVRVTGDSVALDLVAPAATAIGPFVAADDTRWVLSRRLLATDLPDRPRALAGLVTLGFTGPETILLNLESVGTLAVSGSAEVTEDVIRGLAADLAFGPTSALTERTLCLSDASISEAVEAGGIGVEPDPVRAAALLTTALAATAGRAPRSAGAVPVAAGADATADPLVIVLSDQHLDVRVPPRSGCALITTAPVVAAGATLVVHDSGTAVLLPEREHLAPQRLSRAATRDVIEALSAADLPEADPPSGLSHAGSAPLAAAEPVADRTEVATGQAGLWEPPPMQPDVIDLRESASAPGTVADPHRHEEQRLLPVGPDALANPDSAADHGSSPRGRDVECAWEAGSDDDVSDPAAGPAGPAGPAGAAVPRVLVLGEVRVENAHGRCESTRIGRLAETAAFVMLNPGARPSELQGALWPGRRSNPQTCRQMISRARTWLGRTDSGAPYLMTFAETGGRLRLRAEVSSDWADFQQLAARGLADPEDTQSLTAALTLVRGRPFGAVASRELPWADLHINEMLCLITDVAHALADRHERAGRLPAARDAALRGLRTESESAVLEEIVARTAL